MSQRSSDVPMLANFSIYIFPWDLLWTGLYRLKYIFSIDNNANQKSETFNKSQLSEFFDVPSRCKCSIFMFYEWHEGISDFSSKTSRNFDHIRSIIFNISGSRKHSRPAIGLQHQVGFFRITPCIQMEVRTCYPGLQRQDRVLVLKIFN